MTLHSELEQKMKELELVLAIDHIRDTAPEPSAMLAAIANALGTGFQADLCLVCVNDRETEELELKAVYDHSRRFGQLELKPELGEHVRELSDVSFWDRDTVQSVLKNAQLQVKGARQVAVIPIIIGQDEHLGAVILVRTHRPFDSTELALLKTAESQLDSAVIQGYAYFDLQQRTKELETIYRIDRIRDQQLSLDEMLNAVLRELCTTIQAEMGFVMLYDRTGRELELRATTHDDLLCVAPHLALVQRVANEALHHAELIYYNDLGDVLRSMMCIPLILQDEIIGVLGMANRYGPKGFRGEDRMLLRAIGSQMDTAIFESLERRRLRQVLGRSVDPHVMERLLDNPDVSFLQGERMVLTVLYADMRGSTSLAEHTDPESLVGYINDYLSRMTDVILAYEGTLDKFIGDGVMALFGAPFPQSDHALRAVRVGLEMQAAHQAVMAAWQTRGLVPAPIGVGIATGEMTVGEMGSSQRSDYTVIGRAANLGARICTAAKGGQVLISQTTYDLAKVNVEAVPITGLQLKGVDDDVTAYHVVRIL
jgi:adenylate cyclase